MSGLGIAALLSEVAKKLQADFEYKRQTALHPGHKGAEVEDILVEFLNEHLPKRFKSASAFLVDYEDHISRQTDVAIYDALSSPVYRITDESRVLPADTVASVIEVKTSLNKAELEDAYEKIASCKELKRTPPSEMDRAATGSPLSATSLLGVVFAFDADTSLETLAENAKELNTQYDSALWPNLIVVLGKGLIAYLGQFPGEASMIGIQMYASEEFIVPPVYMHLAVIDDQAQTLNRFFILLLSQLTFFPFRSGTPPFRAAMQSTEQVSKTIEAYQFDTSRRLHVVPDDRKGMGTNADGPMLIIDGPDGKPIAQMQLTSWQDGQLLIWRGNIPLAGVLPLLIPVKGVNTFRRGDHELSSVLTLTEAEFRAFPALLAAKSNLRGRIVELPAQGT